MSIKGTFGWSSKKYMTKIENYTLGELTRHHHLKMARYYAICFGAVVALGTTGVALAYSLRQINIIHRKLKIIVSIIVKKGWKVPRCRVRDFMLGLGVGILTLDIGIYGPLIIDCLVGEVVSALPVDAMTIMVNVPSADALAGVGPVPGTDALVGVGPVPVTDALAGVGPVPGTDALAGVGSVPVTDTLAGVGHGMKDALLLQGHTVDAGGLIPPADMHAMHMNAEIQPGYEMGAEAMIALEDAVACRGSNALLSKAAYSVIDA